MVTFSVVGLSHHKDGMTAVNFNGGIEKAALYFEHDECNEYNPDAMKVNVWDGDHGHQIGWVEDSMASSVYKFISEHVDNFRLYIKHIAMKSGSDEIRWFEVELRGIVEHE